MQTLQMDEFLRSLKQNIDTPHSILLGAGASVESGIQSAVDCIWEWKKEIFLSRNPGMIGTYSTIGTASIWAIGGKKQTGCSSRNAAHSSTPVPCTHGYITCVTRQDCHTGRCIRCDIPTSPCRSQRAYHWSQWPVEQAMREPAPQQISTVTS